MKKNILILIFTTLILISCGNNKEIITEKVIPNNNKIEINNNENGVKIENGKSEITVSGEKAETSLSGSIVIGSGTSDKEVDDTMKEIDKIIDDISKE